MKHIRALAVAGNCKLLGLCLSAALALKRPGVGMRLKGDTAERADLYWLKGYR